MTTAFARRFKVDVSNDGTNWLPLTGITDLNPQINPNKIDSTDYDNGGFTSAEITLQSWSVSVKALRKQTGGVFPAGQELVRAAQAQFGDQARVYVRWYDRYGANEAWTGRAIVDWSRSKTGVADLDEVTISLTGDGAATPITNPYNAAAVPVISTVTPSGATTGSLIQITGANFTGTVATTGVKIGGTNATNWVVNSDGLITATVPTGSAGATTVVVTNAAGASASFNYTRGA